MRIWETSDQFPFRTLRALGVVILIHGIILLVLGIFDVIWTVIQFTDSYSNCPRAWPTTLQNPCNHDELVWTWVSVGIWGGFLVILVGILGLMFSRWRVRNLRFQRDMFGVGCILLGFPICPAIITISVLELYYGEGIFYYMSGNELMEEDIAKFVVPLLVAVFAFLVWIIGIAGAVVACCASVGVEESLILQKPQMIAQPQQQLMVQAPQMQMIQQPAVQAAYEIVPIPQPAPPPYMIGPYPMGMPPPIGPMGPMGPMGPPPFGSMGHMGPMGPPPFGPMGPPPFGPMGPPMMGPPPFGRHPMPALMPPPETYM